MRGVDDLACPAAGLVVADRTAFLHVVVRGDAFAHFPFAELKAVPQHIAQRVHRRALGVAREPLQAALLSEVEHEWSHQEKPITRTGSILAPPTKARGDGCFCLMKQNPVVPAQARPTMKLRIAENFRAVFYAPFYAIRALGLAERDGLAIEWVSSEVHGGTIEGVEGGGIDAQWGGPMRVLKEHDSGASSLVCFGEVVGRDPFYLIGRKSPPSFGLKDLAAMRLGIVSEVPTPWYCLRADLEDAGVDTTTLRITKDLTMPQQLEALAAGKLDAVQLFAPYATRPPADGHPILYAASSRGPTSYTTFITSRDTISKHRDAFAALEPATQAMLDSVPNKAGAHLAPPP